MPKNNKANNQQNKPLGGTEAEMNYLPENFGSLVFGDTVMRSRLPSDTYSSLKKTISDGTPLSLEIANVVASSMKAWAIEHGVTHFTHWFQPMTGITAEKHDSFIKPDGKDRAIMKFSGKNLIKGEPDASSFPSGGLRATFEARGYTAWDPTSYAFIKDGVLCIPTAFCSYSGAALDKKTPLLRSMEAIERQSLRILRLFGDTTAKRVVAEVGAEQEYFLIDREMYLRRPDLMYTGRTLFGARPPKGQELDDHYFGAIKKRVKDFMTDLDRELWALGVYAKTEHNEAAPGQHELAVVYSSVNVATDANQLVMDRMRTVAARHDLVCLLHEKPFSYIAGSGKHNNWSLSTDTGINLFDPGETPRENAQFLLFLCAVIKSVDKYQKLLRASVATASNDHRLGGDEAPPAIISIFLGDELTKVLNSIENGTTYEDHQASAIEIGVSVLPNFAKDDTDRNRTSPFAFTGNKFEFRMPGSSLSVAEPNIVLNTITAETLSEFADILEKSIDFSGTLNSIIKDAIKEHRRIIFNGNGYDEAWAKEAKNRGLSDIRSTPEALRALIEDETVEMFERHHVLSRAELLSRYDIMLENYCKTVNIEALTLIDMTNKYIIPAALEYECELAKTIKLKNEANCTASRAEVKLVEKLSSLSDELYSRLEVLTEAEEKTKVFEHDHVALANTFMNDILPKMAATREIIDSLELIVAKKHWPLPSYDEILYSVK